MDRLNWEALPLSVFPPFSVGQLLKERICSSMSIFFPLTLFHPGRQAGSHISCLSLKNWQKIHGRITKHIKQFPLLIWTGV